MRISREEFDELLEKQRQAKLATGYNLAKENLRTELEAQMVEFLAKGGQIKQLDITNRNEESQFNNKVVKIKHGTSHQFNKRSCRCVVCVEWAVKKGILKPGYKRVAA